LGQARILAAREPLERVIADGSRPQALRERLSRVRELRAFAHAELAMPEVRGFETYVATGRRSVVWNVVAAPAFSVEPLRWCFPVAGCVSYRGYFSRDAAQRFAHGLALRGNDTYVYGVSAYSTLGWFRDPVLDTWASRSDVSVAALVFHEFAHQMAWSTEDTGFSEAYAQVVEREGVRRWLVARGQTAAYAAYLRGLAIDAEFAAMVQHARERLAEIYARRIDTAERQRLKDEEIARLRRAYADASRGWPAAERMDQWMGGGLDNARLASVATYEARVPALQALLAKLDGDLAAFHAEARRIAALGAAARAAELDALSPR
jgi:predicted aminopeptidase